MNGHLLNREKRELRNLLNVGIFTPYDFNLLFDTDGALVRIVYNETPAYFFEMREGPGDQWQTVEAPGFHFSTPETQEHTDYFSCRDAIGTWLDRIEEEITLGMPAPEEIARWHEVVDSITDSLPNPRAPFSINEQSAWFARIDEMLQQIRGLEAQADIYGTDPETLRALTDEMEGETRGLMARAGTLPRRIFVRSTFHRVVDFFAQFISTKEGLVFVEKAIQGGLGLPPLGGIPAHADGDSTLGLPT